MGYFSLKIRLIGFVGTLLLFGCASQSPNDSNWYSANEPEQLSHDELQSLKIQAISKSDAKAAYKLYTYYLFTENGMPDAMYWLRVAANNGYPQAEYNLGKFLSQSSSKKDQKEAKVWLAKAAKNGVTTPTK